MTTDMVKKQTIVTTRELENKRVIFEKVKTKKGEELTEQHKYGRVRAFVFHPSEKRCIGFLCKRPDLLLMFHRADSFVALNGFDIVEDGIQLRNGSVTSGEAACRKMGVNWDDCVLWEGMPVCLENGDLLGFARNVSFDLHTGKVVSMNLDEGATAAALLGQKVIPANMILGFKRGIGPELMDYFKSQTEEGEEGEPPMGALLVSNDIKKLAVEGGLAARAGKATGEVQVKAQEALGQAKETIDQTLDQAKPVAQKAAKATGKAVNKGAYATGKQLKRASGMFGAFVDEFKKANK